MNPPENKPAKVAAELDRILEGISEFGSALNAEDHGGSGVELEKSGHAIIRGAFERAPILNSLLPELAAKLGAGESVADDGYKIRDEVTEARKQLSRAPCACVAAAREIYGWTFVDFKTIAERLEKESQNRVATIQCRNCGRLYDVQEDERPATHVIHTWRSHTTDSPKTSHDPE